MLGRKFFNSCMKPSHRLSDAARWLSGVGRNRSGAGGFRLMLLLLAALLFVPVQAPLHSQVTMGTHPSEYDEAQRMDQYFVEKRRNQAREQQEKFRKRIAIPDAVADDVPTLAAIEAAQELKSAPRAEASPFWLQWLVLSVVFVLGGILFVLRLFPDAVENLKDRFAPWDALGGGSGSELSDVRVESQAFADFMAAFRTGPAPRSDDAPALPPVEEFLANWPRLLADLRQQLQLAAQAADPSTRRRFLHDLGRELCRLKGETGLPELLPVWQMICTLEGLIRQLADKVNDVTPSTLRTVGGAVDLLAQLCQPGLDAQLLTRRPVRLLAVDDDPISRHAIAFALKRALHAPDLASEGDAGLALAQAHAYDVIFLDVEMPGMDGFELCTQIHKTALNRNTPVVFVTGQNDFDARVQSTLSGGCDLIAKPFLTFELAVKALTLTMQSRLQQGKVTGKVPEPVPVLDAETVGAQAAVPIMEAPAPTFTPADAAGAPLPPALVETDAAVLPPFTSLAELAPAAARDVEEIATEFLTRAPEHLGWVNELLQSALQVTDETAWLPILSDVYLRLHSFTPDQKFARSHPAMQLSSALEKLLRKLLQSPTPPSKATMLTVTSAVELLRELCATASPQVNPAAPLHLLVVDDDPVARRALTGALQTTFEKPVCAENGETALALAAEQMFDAIFLDVQMPGMDGIEVFARLRSEGRNIETPIVFICGRSDLGTVAELNVRGDCDIVAKPFLAAELLVKSLTLMLRRQQERSGSIS